jgi:hypothetical protein
VGVGERERERERERELVGDIDREGVLEREGGVEREGLVRNREWVERKRSEREGDRESTSGWGREKERVGRIDAWRERGKSVSKK